MPASRLACLNLFVVAASVLAPGFLIHGQERPTGDPSIIDPDAALETLFEGEYRTEGPAVGFDGSVYFVDLKMEAGGTIWRLDPRSGHASVLLRPSGFAAGLEVDPEGNLLIAEAAWGGGRRISRLDIKSGEVGAVTDSFEGKPYHSTNDLTLDDAGRIYFTESDYVGPGDLLYHSGSGVYRVDPDGTVERVIGLANRPNGIAVSPDQRTLYVGMNRFDVLANRAILAYDLTKDGDVRFRSILARMGRETGQLYDGMAVDEDGNLYVALFSTRSETGVRVFRPDGEQVAFIPTPAPATNVVFGSGEDANSVYITADNGLYRVRVRRRGYHPPWRYPR